MQKKIIWQMDQGMSQTNEKYLSQFYKKTEAGKTIYFFAFSLPINEFNLIEKSITAEKPRMARLE